MGYLDELKAASQVCASTAEQIRGAYGALLEELQRRELGGERLVLADLIAYQFLLEKFLGASVKCDVGAMPPLVRRLPLDRPHHDEALTGIADVHVYKSDRSLEASSQSTASSPWTYASDREAFDPCTHCANSAECKQLGCAYEELLESIAARLEAIRAA